jgi:hypothetical protein
MACIGGEECIGRCTLIASLVSAGEFFYSFFSGDLIFCCAVW